MAEFFTGVDKIRYEGPTSDNPFSFRYYDADRIVLPARPASAVCGLVCSMERILLDSFCGTIGCGRAQPR